MKSSAPPPVLRLVLTLLGVGAVAWSVGAASRKFISLFVAPSAGATSIARGRERERVGWAEPSAGRPLPFAAPRSAVPDDVRAAHAAARDPQQRAALLAAMRAWGEHDVIAAVAWAVEQDEPLGALVLEAALEGGATTRPDFAAEIGRQLLAADPTVGAAQAAVLIQAFGHAGRFDLALQLAAAAPAGTAADLTSDAFAAWARQSPLSAVAALDQLGDDALRRRALLAVVKAWAADDPAAVARYAWNSLGGEDRSYAIRQAVDQWAKTDLTGLTVWLGSIPAGPERDVGAAVAAVGLAPSDPKDAFAWTASISNSDERFRLLQRVATGVDRDVARVYLDQVAGLGAGERDALRRQLDCSP